MDLRVVRILNLPGPFAHGHYFHQSITSYFYLTSSARFEPSTPWPLLLNRIPHLVFLRFTLLMIQRFAPDLVCGNLGVLEFSSSQPHPALEHWISSACILASQYEMIYGHKNWTILIVSTRNTTESPPVRAERNISRVTFPTMGRLSPSYKGAYRPGGAYQTTDVPYRTIGAHMSGTPRSKCLESSESIMVFVPVKISLRCSCQ